MAYKVFLAPTDTGNTVFEGDVLNGYTTPDGRMVSLQFFSNDRGYTAANYQTDHAGAKALYQELKTLLEEHGSNERKFEARSTAGNFRLEREYDGTPLILFFQGNDTRRGRCFHRGDAVALKKILAEFEIVLKTLDDVVAGKGPEA